MDNMSMKSITVMYIRLFRTLSKAYPTPEEYCDLVQGILNVLESNLKDYEIPRFDYNGTGGSPEDAMEYYIEELSKKYLGIENIWETKYWKYEIYVPTNAKIKIEVDKTMDNIKTKEQVNKFLDWYKEQMDCCIVSYFNYTIINKEDISTLVKNHSDKEIRIEIQDWNDDIYNPIICWIIHDPTTLMIMDWRSLKHEAKDWISGDCIENEFIEEFSLPPTLKEYLEEEYGDTLHKEVRLALEQEVNEFYNIYKDDIYIENDSAFSKSDNMMLVDAIWNHAPLFCNQTIEHYVMKIYNGELRL